MALSQQQEFALYQILEMPWQPTVNQLIDKDNLVAMQITIGNDAGIRQAKASLTAYLATYITGAAETALLALLNRWISIGTKTVHIDAGSVGNLGGVTFDYAAERSEIQRQVRVIIPFYRKHESIERDNSGTIAFIR